MLFMMSKGNGLYLLRPLLEDLLQVVMAKGANLQMRFIWNEEQTPMGVVVCVRVFVRFAGR